MPTSTPKTIWITGASSGIGKACADVYANRGYRVILSSRRSSTLEDVATELSQSEKVNRNDLFIVPLDLSDSSNFKSVVEDVIKKVGVIDIVLHAGGISQRSLAVDTSIEVYRSVMEIDYFGTITLTKALLPHFIAKKNGQ